MFQSTPDSIVGRYFVVVDMSQAILGVSIHARLNSRAIPGSWPADARAISVSIHARLNSRAIPNGAAWISRRRLFQSTPDSIVGRYARKDGQGPGDHPVSIHARLNSRAIQNPVIDCMRGFEFQSTPDSIVGRYGWAMDARHADHRVSIHARLNSRAIRRVNGLGFFCRGFQSTPDSIVGRYLVTVWPWYAIVGFNPRPTQ